MRKALGLITMIVFSRLMYPLRILKRDFEVGDDLLRQAYFSTVRSVLEYCAPLFAGVSKKDSSRLQSLQKRFHKILCGTRYTKSCLPCLESRRELLILRFFERMRSNCHILNFLFPSVSVHGRVILEFHRTSRRGRSLLPMASILFNWSFCRWLLIL